MRSILKVCKDGNLDEFNKTLKIDIEGAFKEKDHDGKNALHIAAENGRIDIVKEIIATDKGRKLLLERTLKIITLPGCKPLYFAASNGHLDVVKEILKTSEGRESLDDDALFVAAWKGRHEIVREFLDTCKGKKLVSCQSYYTIMDEAVVMKREAVVEELLKVKEGRDLIYKERYNVKINPFDHAAWTGQTKILRMILESQDVDKQRLLNHISYGGFRPFELAYSKGFFNQFVAAFDFADRRKLYASHPIMTMMSNKLLSASIVACTAAITSICIDWINASSQQNMAI
jgi:hypothetical protein